MRFARWWPSRGIASPLLAGNLLLAGILGWTTGCASPGSPRAPSLRLPEPVRDLSATRSGDRVQLRFTLPARTTDGQPLRDKTLAATLCRQSSPTAPCRPVDSAETAAPLSTEVHGSVRAAVVWADLLPPELTAGPARPIAYRVELRNEAGRSAGFSDPVYTAAGAAPPPVVAFAAEGTRLGVLLRWAPVVEKGDVLLERQRLGEQPAPPSAGPARPVADVRVSRAAGKARAAHSAGPADAAALWLHAAYDASTPDKMLDTSAEDGTAYRYTAVRSLSAKIGGRTLELRSAPSSPVEITWRDVYPPPAPAQLSALGYRGGGEAYAVDLVWQPVNDPRVTGYLVERLPLSATGEPAGTPERLTPEPLVTPAFHDTTATAGRSYRYAITAVDARGNRSPAAATTVAAASTR